MWLRIWVALSAIMLLGFVLYFFTALDFSTSYAIAMIVVVVIYIWRRSK